MSYLPAGLPRPTTESDRLDQPYRDGLLADEIRVQRCRDCATWQWGPEWICHNCHSFALDWTAIEGVGTVWSWTRCWHPVHPALKDYGPYLAVLVELPGAGNIRMIGNLLGDPQHEVEIGMSVTAEIERHDGGDQPYALLQWRRTDR